MPAAHGTIDDFWAWFTKNEPAIFAAGSESSCFDELFGRLQAIDEHLTYECSPAAVSPREMIFSADGIKEGFGAVDAVVDAAPKLDRWHFIRFRPRQADYASVSIVFGQQRVRGSDIEYVITTNGVQIGLDIFIRGCERDDAEDFVKCAYLFADAALGEYDMECKVGMFRIHAWDSELHREHRHPFADLREHFDAVFESDCLQGE